MDPKKQPPPRLDVVQARGADVAVVFRRGPSNWCAVLRWDTNTGDVQVGAWIKGRIYGGDLSHDGRFLSTMLMKGGRVFNVVSVAPWLHPLHSEEQGDTWGSHWMFLDPGESMHPQEVRVGPSPSRTVARLATWQFRQPSTHPIPAAIARTLPPHTWSGLSQHRRVLVATTTGLLQVAEVRGGNKLIVVSEFDTATLTPDPQPPPEYAKHWGGAALARTSPSRLEKRAEKTAKPRHHPSK